MYPGEFLGFFKLWWKWNENMKTCRLKDENVHEPGWRQSQCLLLCATCFSSFSFFFASVCIADISPQLIFLPPPPSFYSLPPFFFLLSTKTPFHLKWNSITRRLISANFQVLSPDRTPLRCLKHPEKNHAATFFFIKKMSVYIDRIFCKGIWTKQNKTIDL